MQKIKDLFKQFDQAMILDVAVGKGGFLPFIFELAGHNFKQIIGIDPSKEAIEIAKKEYENKKVAFYQHSAENLPFEDESFDLVTISNALHHVNDIKLTIEEMKRVKSKNGFIFISEMYRDNQDEKAETFLQFHDLKSSSDRLKGTPHNDTFNRQEIIDMLQHSGLTIRYQTDWENENAFVLSKEEFQTRMDNILSGLEKTSELENFKKKTENLTARYHSTGIKMPKKLLVVTV
jgi:ubiquinone/menaquinone biosynthesis C-methylase UbiE